MTEPFRLGVAGLVHDHVWNELQHWHQTGRVDLVAVADAHPELRERAVQDFGFTRQFSDPCEMLAVCGLDGVQICTTNAAALPVVEAAAARGVHIVLEKPMAATLAQADRMLQAVNGSTSRMLINWPFRWRAATVRAWEAIQQGVIGDVFESTIRMAHEGPREMGCSEYFCQWLYDADQNGAGALVDYCCYGAVAFRYLFGRPQAVQGLAARLTKTDISVEDNARVTLIYPHRFANTEASWSQLPPYHDAVFLGTRGTLWTSAGQVWLAEGRNQPRQVELPPLPPEQQNGPAWFLHCLDNGLPFGDVCEPLVCRDAQEILELGLQSARSGRTVALS